jgi:Domain of unknown function (DUF4287)
MATVEKVKGPASYFPSIEKKYGKKIEHWLNLVGKLNGMKHMEMVAWLSQNMAWVMGTQMRSLRTCSDQKLNEECKVK